MKTLICAVTVMSLTFMVSGLFGKTRGQEVARAYEKEAATDLSDMDFLPLLPPRILRSIGLDAKQEQQVSQLVRSRQGDVKATGNRIRQASCALDLAVLSDQMDGALIDRLKKELVLAETAMGQLRADVYRQLPDVLTAGQVAEYARLDGQRLDRRQAGGGLAGNPQVPFLRIALDELTDLTADQLKRIDQILASHGDELLTSRRRGGATRQALDEAAMTRPFDAAKVSQKEQDYVAAQANHVDQRTKVLAEIHDVLRPAQLAKLRKIKSDNCNKEQPY